MSYEEKTINKEYIYKGAILNLRRDKVAVENGTSYREIIEHGGAVAMVPITKDGNVVMVKQYRKPVNEFILEIPAGKKDGGEDSIDAARRELKEETGYKSGCFKLLTRFYPSVGYSEEVIDLYLCTELTHGKQSLDEDESIDVYEIPLSKVVGLIMDGMINDGKTIAAIMMAKEILEEK